MDVSARIVMVEDDGDFASLVVDYLEDYGLEVAVVPDGAAAPDFIKVRDPHLVILDMMLPNRDGLEICREIRAWYEGPILFLTARSGWVDEIVGLELGADDYLRKPVEPRLLLARIRNLLKRSGKQSLSPSPKEQPGSLEIDIRKRLALLGDRELELTDAEFDLLVYMQEHAGEHLSREQLSRDVCGVEYDGLDRTIDVRVGRLRAKLGDDAKSPRWIKSIRSVGYLFIEPEN